MENAERINEALGEEGVQRADTTPPDEVQVVNLDTIDLPFEVIRPCSICGTEKTHAYFGRLTIPQWIDILSTDYERNFICRSCREHAGDEAI